VLPSDRVSVWTARLPAHPAQLRDPARVTGHCVLGGRVSLVSFCQAISCLNLPLVTLTFLESTAQLLCTVPLGLGLSISSWLHSDEVFLVRRSWWRCGALSGSYQEVHSVNFDHLVKSRPARMLWDYAFPPFSVLMIFAWIVTLVSAKWRFSTSTGWCCMALITHLFITLRRLYLIQWLQFITVLIKINKMLWSG
jgi:hypothetical protein